MEKECNVKVNEFVEDKQCLCLFFFIINLKNILTENNESLFPVIKNIFISFYLKSYYKILIVKELQNSELIILIIFMIFL